MCKSVEIIDKYLIHIQGYSRIRLRKFGDKFELTKKIVLDENDKSKLEEQNIALNEEEYNVLNKLNGDTISKTRYYFNYQGAQVELDIFSEGLQGLVTAEIEFQGIDDRDKFELPPFCLVDVTQERFISAPVLAGKKYEDIEKELEKFNYKKLFLNK